MRARSVILLVAAMAASFGAVWGIRRLTRSDPAFVRDARAVIAIPAPVTAAKTAANPLVRVTFFGTYSCGPCIESARIWQDVLGDHPGELEVEYRYLRSREAGWDAADRAVFRVAEKGKFWDLHRDVLRLSELPSAALVGSRSAAYLAGSRATSSPESESGAPSGAFVSETVASFLEVTRLPTTFVNGRRVEGLASRATLSRLVAVELARAKELAAAARSPRAVEDALLKELGTTREAVSLAKVLPAGEKCPSPGKLGEGR